MGFIRDACRTSRSVTKSFAATAESFNKAMEIGNDYLDEVHREMGTFMYKANVQWENLEFLRDDSLEFQIYSVKLNGYDAKMENWLISKFIKYNKDKSEPKVVYAPKAISAKEETIVNEEIFNDVIDDDNLFDGFRL